MANITKASELHIKVGLKGTKYENEWSIWVYPAKIASVNSSAIFTNSIEDAKQMLLDGKNVLLNPDTSKIKGIAGRFAPVFWSPVHFPNQPGTMGLLMDSTHPAFTNFPTNNFTNWQWWDLIKLSKTMDIDSCYKNCTSIITVVDNFFKNRRLSNLVETKYKNGKLLIVTIDITHNLDQRPEARQLRYSLLEYMNSNQFTPTLQLTEEKFKNLLGI